MRSGTKLFEVFPFQTRFYALVVGLYVAGYSFGELRPRFVSMPWWSGYA